MADPRHTQEIQALERMGVMIPPDDSALATLWIAHMFAGAVSAAMVALNLDRLPTFVTPHGGMVQGLPTEDVQPELAKAYWPPANPPRDPNSLPFLWIVTKDGELRQGWPMEHVTVCPKFDNATLERVGLSIEVSSEPFPAQEIDDSAA